MDPVTHTLWMFIFLISLGLILGYSVKRAVYYLFKNKRER